MAKTGEGATQIFCFLYRLAYTKNDMILAKRVESDFSNIRGCE